MANLKIEYREVTSLTPYLNNARTHSDQQVHQLAASIKEFGFVNPILLDSNDVIIAGHGRLMAAMSLQMEKVPCVKVGYLSDRQVKALVLADNRIAMSAGWDFEKLSEELSSLAYSDFDLDLLGFDEQELDGLLKADADILPESFGPISEEKENQKPQRTEEVGQGLTDDDAAPEEPIKPVSKRGDVWLLGDHRLMCGDSTDGSDVAILMVGKKADMVFTDPPYNVKISGLGSASARQTIGKIHGEFVMASGEMDEEQFTNFLRKVFTNLASHSKDGAINYVCMDWRHMLEVLNASDAYANLQQNGGGNCQPSSN
jgi:hypothetical protein